MRRWFVRAMCALGLAAAAAMALPNAASAVPTQAKPWVVVLCKFTDRPDTPRDVAYFQDMFANAGKSALVDYWRDASLGAVSITGTIVKGWYTLPVTSYEFIGYSRGKRSNLCASAANNDVDFSKFHGVVTIMNSPPQPNPVRTAVLVNAIDADDTSITVKDATPWPAPPYPAYVGNERLHITAVNGNTWTIERGYEGSKPEPHAAGAQLSFQNGGDLFGCGPGCLNLDGKALGHAFAQEDIDLTGMAHEMGHGFGFPHSRKLSTSTADYGDCYDIMSAYGCVHRFPGAAFGSNPASGPGFNAINLDRFGWIDANRKHAFDNSTCRRETITLGSLSHAPAAGYLQTRVPATKTIETPKDANGNPTSTTSDYYSLELRTKEDWDRAIPASAVLVHLHGQDGLSYLADSAGSAGALTASSSTFADAGERTFVVLHDIDAAARTAQVTLSGCKIPLTVSYTGGSTGTYGENAPFSATVTFAGSSVPAPRVLVSFAIGEATCSAQTDVNGKVECGMRLREKPGSYTVRVSTASDEVYEAGSTAVPFTVGKAQIPLTYTGATTAVHHHPATVSARLGRDRHLAAPTGSISFQLGATDSCTAALDDAFAAACAIRPTQAAGTYPIVATFPGDDYYLPATVSTPFTITRQPTSLTYVGDSRIANGTSARLSAVLKEDLGEAVAGRTVSFTLGTGSSSQRCVGVTDSAGAASCTIASVAQPLDSSASVPVLAVFEQDPFYFGSSTSARLALEYFTGRAFGLSASVGVSPLALTVPPTPDTGAVRTAAARTVPPRCAASAGLLLLVRSNNLCANVGVTLAPGTMTSTSTVADVKIGLTGLPVIELRGVSSTSRSSCTGAAGATTLTLVVAGVERAVSLEPNTAVDIGLARLVVNEQKPVPGADKGVTVNAAHLTMAGGTDIVIASTTSAAHNCD